MSNDLTYSEMLARKLALIKEIDSSPLDGGFAQTVFLAQCELVEVAWEMQVMEAQMPF